MKDELDRQDYRSSAGRMATEIVGNAEISLEQRRIPIGEEVFERFDAPLGQARSIICFALPGKAHHSPGRDRSIE